MLSFKMDFSEIKKGLQRQTLLIDKAVEKGLARVALELKRDQIAKKDVPRDIGGLINSWKVENGGHLTLKAGFDIIYAMYQHQGQREDGTHKIINRPAGGRTYWFKETLDKNQEKYFKLFGETIKKEMKWL